MESKDKYVARINNGKGKSRSLRKIAGANSLEEAWEKIKQIYPEDKIVSVQLSKRWLEKENKS